MCTGMGEKIEGRQGTCSLRIKSTVPFWGIGTAIEHAQARTLAKDDLQHAPMVFLNMVKSSHPENWLVY